MPDSRDFSGSEPLDWSGAFLALPLESPPADGWAAVSQSLASRTARPSVVGRRERRANWLIWTASAAVVAVVAWAPLDRWLDASKADAARLAAAATPARSESNTGPKARDSADRLAHADRIDGGASVALVSPSIAAKDPAASLPTAGDAAPKRPRHSRAQPASSSRTTSSTVAVEPPDVLQPSIDVSPATDTAVAATADPLPQLYAESAQLEALVAFARDDRVASASGAVLTGELDAHIGLIDAALSQSDLSPAQRNALWQQRIDALRELAGIESTERWLAAHGERLEGALVRVD